VVFSSSSSLSVAASWANTRLTARPACLGCYTNPWDANSDSTRSWCSSMKESLHFAGLPGHIPAQCNSAGATPIISAICLLIQDLQLLLTPKPGQLGRLGPGTLRQILRSAANGTPITGGVAAMPDGAAILRNEYVSP
jgi:hypothetical protein